MTRTRPFAAPALATPEQVAQRRANLTLAAFYEYHRTLWLRYALLQVGDRHQAARLVREVHDQLAQDWELVLRQESVPQYAWTALKDHIHHWLTLHRRTPVMPDTAAFRAAMRKLLVRELQDGWALLESELGLYTAISELPERQCDVIVLRYVLKAEDHDIAEYLGTTTDTVRSHVMRAKDRLATKLTSLLKEEA
ncbi:sigma-70 family RNA polymerase sigma factor [Streptomyces sp. NPDC006733]|uniref:RNA polymerase sigma factor n=1 Tax=Streptomyces sp. NPDC006733 TaxID=3155460 RepID=UPI0033D6CD20